MHSRVPLALIYALTVAVLFPFPAASHETSWDLPTQSLSESLREFGEQAELNVLFEPGAVAGRQAPAVRGAASGNEVLAQLLAGTGLTYRYVTERTVTLVRALKKPAPSLSSDEPKKMSLIVLNSAQTADGAGQIRLAQSESATVPAGAHTRENRGEADADNEDPRQHSEGALQEIIVTAQKREQSLQDVGISVAAFTGEQLQQLGIKSATDITIMTPGVHVNGSYANQILNFTIRGVVQNDSSEHTEAPVAVYVDDGYQAALVSQKVAMFDIERMEILKGPQGTLFGRNATGGAVNIVSKKPTDHFEAYVDALYGYADTARVQGAVSGPLSKKVSARLAAMVHYNDSFYENIFPGGTDLGRDMSWAARGHLQFQPNEDVKLLLTAHATESKLSTSAYQSRSTRVVTNEQGQVIDSVELAEPTLLGTTDPDGSGLTVSHNFSDSDSNVFKSLGGTARLDWKWADSDFTSITDVKQVDKDFFLDADASEVPFFNTFSLANVDSFSQEFRLNGERDRMRWFVGAYYLNIDANVSGTGIDFTALGVTLQDEFSQRTDSYSGYGQVEWDLQPNLTFIGGLRGTQEDKRFDFRSNAFVPTGNPLNPAGELLGANRPPISLDSSDVLVSWKAQLDWRPVEDWLLYAGINRGTKAGSFNAPFAGDPGLPLADIPYDPEVLLAYETGFKSTLMNGRARFNGSAFYYDYKDYQAYQLIGVSTRVTNVSAKISGLELDLTVQPADGLTLYGAVSALDAKVKDVDFGGVIADRRPAFTPEFKASALARYEWGTAQGRAALQGEVAYTDSYYYSLQNFSSTREDGYSLGNIRLSYHPNSAAWEASAFVENVWDERYFTVGFDLSGACGCSETAYGMPRWWGVGFRYNF
jgi:iron complex outermembrane receptor protein